eukprot:6488525-Prymnesium_polylepis.1
MYVPDMPKCTTLVSTRYMLRSQGIKVFFNDDNYLEMPNGKKLSFGETEQGYFLVVDWSFDATNLLPHQFYCPVLPSYKPRWKQFVQSIAHALGAHVSDDTVHERLCHFSWERIRASASCTTGLDLARFSDKGHDGQRRHCDGVRVEKHDFF